MSTNNSNTNPSATTQSVPDDLDYILERLQDLIDKGKIYIMDEDNGVVFPAYIAMKYKNNKILIACPR